jgi:aminomuconate-semialdehyde/2-hydroxymuconate-6-semialdehyde dehydrogenase
MITIENFIAGAFAPAESGEWIENISPVTGSVYSRIPASGKSDVARAVRAAEAAFPEWSARPARERSAILLRIADLIAANARQLAEAETTDSGKPIFLSETVDIPRSEANIRFFATAILHTHSEAHHTDSHTLNYTNRRPLGVVGCISPWNLPLYLFTWKIAPALAAGNCVLAKPSELTPMTAWLFSRLCAEAGLPDGVLQVIHGTGSGAGQAIVEHPAVKAISFTGGTATGAAIARIAAPGFKKLSLELGGKNPVVIFGDCEFSSMLDTTVRSSFTNQGQICLCGSRILVEKTIYGRFVEEFVARVSRLKPADPMSPDSRMGALVSEAHLEKVMGYIRLAQEEGGTILTGGNRVYPGGALNGGYYLEPTVIAGLGPACRTNQEEIFGPVVTVMPFETEEEAVKLANCTEYGLAATIWTGDLSRAHRVAARMDAGVIWINTWMLRDLRTPFGGMKNSGVGREGGEEALRFFTEMQNVCISF